MQGFGLKTGAIASTVCYDHLTLACVATPYADMALASTRLSALEDDFVVVRDDQVPTQLALPVAGLTNLEPFLQLAFIALPVIPALKITDRGSVDATRFELIG